VNTFSNEKEIDLKRDRELQAIDNNLTQQKAALKPLANGWRMRSSAAAFEKNNKDKKPVPQVIKDDVARAEARNRASSRTSRPRKKTRRTPQPNTKPTKNAIWNSKARRPRLPTSPTPMAPPAPTPAVAKK
jgi:hypothetical protein